MSVVEKYYKGGLELGTATWEGLTAAVLDAALKELPERDISRLLCYTSSISMEVALRGLSGETRKKVFSCMSKRLAFTMAEYLDNAGTMKVTEIGEACAKILNDAQRLMEHGDILDINKDLIDRTNSYIQAKSAQPPDRKMVHAAGKELVKVLNTYMGKDNLVIAPVKKEQEPEEERGYEDR
jgi:predicted nucleotidyltransferase component of viral defense system